MEPCALVLRERQSHGRAPSSGLRCGHWTLKPGGCGGREFKEGKLEEESDSPESLEVGDAVKKVLKGKWLQSGEKASPP